jgi:predicted nucleic-acid-binding Zn-ribbon protein
MVTCLNCGTDVAEPDRTLRNNFFVIDAYTCPKCRNKFNHSKYNYKTEV